MIKPGDKIRTIGYLVGIEAIVERVEKWDDDGELPSIENHGTIFLRVTSKNEKTKMSWTSVGDEEHFCYFEWQKHLEIIGG